MPEAVIVATARSPIGRAYKGSLRDMRPDDLAVQMVNAVLAKTPQLDPRDIEDLVLGSAQPGGEAGYNLARVVAVLAGTDHLPSTTVNRFCASSLQAIRMAAHAVKAGEGDAFIAVGVEAVSRYVHGVDQNSVAAGDEQRQEPAGAVVVHAHQLMLKVRSHSSGESLTKLAPPKTPALAKTRST